MISVMFSKRSLYTVHLTIYRNSAFIWKWNYNFIRVKHNENNNVSSHSPVTQICYSKALCSNYVRQWFITMPRPVYRIKGQEEMIKRNLGNFENKPFTLLQAVISWNRVNLFQNCKKSGYESFTYNVFSYYNSHTVGGMKIFCLHQR